MPGGSQSFQKEVKFGIISVPSSHSTFTLSSDILLKKKLCTNVWEKVAVLLFALTLFYEQLFW